jgi:hypothetical protein
MTNTQLPTTGPAGPISWLDEVPSQLRTATELTRLAREMTLKASGGLSGARKARALELAEKLADCQAHGQRLYFVVTGDTRADGTGQQ